MGTTKALFDELLHMVAAGDLGTAITEQRCNIEDSKCYLDFVTSINARFSISAEKWVAMRRADTGMMERIIEPHWVCRVVFRRATTAADCQDLTTRGWQGNNSCN
eukprot:Mycagemm_TRINITY_DN4247_c0_g1::TRINITY_DN4247_c0_g1_i1::g.2945::m.2945 type:complete len:105 gc:universal TRINITY_DN4247_c0_g1_i1:131-445(+)